MAGNYWNNITSIWPIMLETDRAVSNNSVFPRIMIDNENYDSFGLF